jgi:2-polyprenyl-3-methyl-5-hydroxy-6-metoxy-1,4-benzoquinol methylase
MPPTEAIESGPAGRTTARMAFGVDASRPERYSLRQSRYAVLASDIDAWAGAAAARGETTSLLDVGCGWGPLLCHLKGKPNFGWLRLTAADLAAVFDNFLYEKELYEKIVVGDLTDGYPEIPSESYDIVVCEQVLEHLADVEAAIATLVRVVRPGGKLVIGVPIFIPPLRFARAHLVPAFATLLGSDAVGTHLQAFSLGSMLKRLRRHRELRLVQARGFRIISGGPLRGLENYHWWWRFNLALGRLFPAACIEVQIILEKRQ